MSSVVARVWVVGLGHWFNKFGLRISFGDGSSSVFARWFCLSSGSYSYPCVRPLSQQQFDRCDHFFGRGTWATPNLKGRARDFLRLTRRVVFKPPIFAGLETAAPSIFEQKITKGAKLPEFQSIHSNSSFSLLPSVHRSLSSALFA